MTAKKNKSVPWIPLVASLALLLISVAVLISGHFYAKRSVSLINARLSEYGARVNGVLLEKASVTEFMKEEIVSSSYDKSITRCAAYLKECLSRDADAAECFVGFSDGTVIYSGSDDNSKGSFNPSSSDWYRLAAGSSGTVISGPYANARTEKNVVIFSEKIVRDGKVSAVAAREIYLDCIIEPLSGLGYSPKSYPFILDRNGQIIFHPYSTSKEAQTLKNADSSNDLLSGDYVCVNIDSAGWLLCYSYDKSELMAPYIRAAAVIIIIAAMISMLIPMFMKSKGKYSAAKSADRNAANADNASNGADLVIVSDESSSTIKEYIADISRRLDSISHGFLNIGADRVYTGDFAALDEAIDRISRVLSGIFGILETTLSTAAENADIASENALRFEENLSVQKYLIKEISEHLAETEKGMNESASLADTALEWTGHARSAVSDSSGKINELMGAIGELSAISDELKGIVATEEELTRQANVLAFRAAIGAANADSGGRELASTADNAKNLAAKCSEASELAAKLSESSAAVIENVGRLVREAGAAAENAAESVRETKGIIAAARENTLDMLSHGGDIAQKIEAAADNINDNSEGLKELTEKTEALKELLKRFEKQKSFDS